MRGGDDVGSRMRVAAAAALVSSGLFAGGVSAAVASADPDGGSEPGGAGTPGRTSDESAGHQHRSGPREIARAGTVTKAGSGSIGRRFAAPPTDVFPAPAEPAEPSEDAADDDASKLPEAADPGAETVPDGAPGEQDVSEEPDDEDEECGWWPFPPDLDVVASGGGGGYEGAAPSTGLVIAPPPELSADAPAPLFAAEPAELPVPAAPALSLPVIAVLPAVPELGGTGAGGAWRPPAQVGPVRPPVRREPPQPPAAPPAGDAAVPVSYRAGYGEYLRTADLPALVAVAVPGATGIMLLTGAGGLIGYRQARAGHAIRAGAAGRFSS